MDLSFTREIRVPVGDPKLAMIEIEKFLILRPGDEAPDFVATTLDGKPFKLSELRGKVVLIDFWATWCTQCIAELPNVKQAYEEFSKGGDFVVVGISLDDRDKSARQFCERNKVPWTQIVLGPAEQNPVAKQYNVSSIPATFLIGRDGKVVATDVRSWSLRHQLSSLLSPPKEQAGR